MTEKIVEFLMVDGCHLKDKQKRNCFRCLSPLKNCFIQHKQTAFFAHHSASGRITQRRLSYSLKEKIIFLFQCKPHTVLNAERVTLVFSMTNNS
jgi:hypothetical protein